MTTILLTVVMFGVLVAAMAIGVMFGRPPIKGACGGMSAMGLKEDCEICGGDRSKCEEAGGQPGVRAGSGRVERFDPGER